MACLLVAIVTYGDKMRLLLLVVSSLILTSCSTVSTEKYEALLNGWLNRSELDLVSHWGAPDNVYQVEDKKFLSYYSQHNSYIPSTAYYYQPFFTGGWPYYDPIEDASYQVISKVCKTTFTIEQHTITHWNHQGDGCIAQ